MRVQHKGVAIAALAVAIVTAGCAHGSAIPSTPLQQQGSHRSTPAAVTTQLTPAPGATFTPVFEGLNPGAAPYSLYAGAQNVWFTDRGYVKAIGYVSQTAPYIVHEYPLQSKTDDPFEITYNAKYNSFWATEASGGNLIRVDAGPTVKMTFYSLGIPADTSSTGIAVDASGKLWVALSDNSIVAFDPASKAVVARFTFPSRFSDPFALAFDQDGYLWIAERSSGYVFAVNSAGRINVEFCCNNRPVSLALGSDGRIYSVDQQEDFFKSFTLHSYTGAPLIGGCLPSGIAAGRGATLNYMWVTESACNAIVRITPHVGYTAYANSEHPDGVPNRIAVDPAGNVWYSDAYKHIMYKVTFSLGS